MLLSNSLFLDSEYKADCETKINYLEVLKSNADAEFNDEEIDNDILSVDISNNLDMLLTRIIEADEKPYFSDMSAEGAVLFNTKNIGNNYYKILLEINNIPRNNIEQ